MQGEEGKGAWTRGFGKGAEWEMKSCRIIRALRKRKFVFRIFDADFSQQRAEKFPCYPLNEAIMEGERDGAFDII